MRFASLSSGTSNYAAAAKPVADSAANAFAIMRQTGPDYAGLSQVAMQTKSAEKVAAMKAGAHVATAGIKAVADVTETGIKTAAGMKLVRDKANRVKMAGKVAGIGAVLGGAVMAATDKKEDNSWKDKYTQQSDALNQAYLEYLSGDGSDEGSGSEFRPQTMEEWRKSKGLPEPSSGGSTDQPSSSGGVVRSVSASGGRITQEQGKQLLMAQGMPEADARIGAAVMMAESAGKPDARSHPDLEARTGEMSIGLWQHNKNTGEDRHGFYGIKDWSELKDPQTNARATYRLWKRRGGWGDWGAFTDGSYKQYL